MKKLTIAIIASFLFASCVKNIENNTNVCVHGDHPPKFSRYGKVIYLPDYKFDSTRKLVKHY
jgi:hypothetical protein